MSDNQHDDPEASRPVMPPEYGMLGATEGGDCCRGPGRPNA